MEFLGLFLCVGSFMGGDFCEIRVEVCGGVIWKVIIWVVVIQSGCILKGVTGGVMNGGVGI